jgi:hypothetical protein
MPAFQDGQYSINDLKNALVMDKTKCATYLHYGKAN